MTAVALGLDFGTESVRAILVDAEGVELGQGIENYRSGQITDVLPKTGGKLPPHYALQDPNDWIESATEATRVAIQKAAISGNEVVGIGVDFTSCTMLPTKRDGTPLCQIEQLGNNPLSWPKLWKHHGALAQTARMNSVARERNESFLSRYGGTIGLEWFFPKMLETIELAPEIDEQTDVWIEAGDWFVWQLTGGAADDLCRSTCQAGYKGLWSREDGYPSSDYLNAVHPQLAVAARDKLPGRMMSPGECAGGLCDAMARRLGLQPGTPVSAAIIDAHSAVPGVGVAEPGALVMVLGTSSCHMLNSLENKFVPGVAGIVDGGILPGMFGYETGQAAVGDAFAWLMKLVGQGSLEHVTQQAMRLPPGAEGVLCMDWLNGCRTPLMDGALAEPSLAWGYIMVLAIFTALLEASGFGLRWIVELLREHGVPVDRFVATGGLPHHNRGIIDIYADVLGAEIEVHPSQYGPAVGAAVLGMVAAGPKVTGLPDLQTAAKTMAGVPAEQADIVFPRKEHQQAYRDLYQRYLQLAETLRQYS